MRLRVVGCAAALATISAAAGGQGPARAAGLVRDSLRTPITEAEVSTAVARARTDSLGRFSLSLTPADSTTITVRRVGYSSVTFTLFTDSLARNDLDIELLELPRVLPTVTIAERRARVPSIEGFEERRKTRGGFGFFISRDQLRDRESDPLTSILREAKGVKIYRQANGRALLRFTRWTTTSISKGVGGQGGCAPSMWLDGVQTKNLEVDDIPTMDVEAVEMYANASSAPHELNATGEFRCGLIAIWTRRPILRSR